MAKSDSTNTPKTGDNVQALRERRAQETDPAKAAELDRQISDAESQGGTAQR